VVEEEKAEDGTAKLKARQRFVRTGRTKGDFVAVTEGLKAGESVVVAGAFKLRNGVQVLINNDMAPEPQLRPEPPDT
jgi:membrane fusion protein (multidrug efflux system)